MELVEDQPARAALGGAAVLSPAPPDVPGPSRRRLALERAVLAGGTIAFFIAGYFGVGLHVDPASAREMRTAWDARIPFVASTIWIYLWVFPASLLPLFLIRCPRLFRRTILAYTIAIGVSLAVFAAYPVTSRALRADPAALDVTRVSPWAVSVVYRLDPPYNLFPSLHLSIAALAALSAWKASRTYGAAVAAGVVLIGVSICTVKQHFLLDGFSGVALAGAVHAVVLRSYVPPDLARPSYGWRGPAAYFVLMALVYAGFVAAFLRST